jgi:hypothetical protein
MVEDRSQRSYKLRSGGSCGDGRRHAAAPVEYWSQQSYQLHSCSFGGGLETSRGGAGGGLEPEDIDGAPSLSHGPAAERPELGLGEPESTARLGQPTGQCHSPAPTGVRRGTSDGQGWIGSKVVAITGSRVGPPADQEVPLREF